MATLYIIYNANGSVLGKAQYAFKKLSSSASDSPCSACDLTHNGLNLTETRQWSSTKERIGAKVYQLHRDELDDDVSTTFSFQFYFFSFKFRKATHKEERKRGGKKDYIDATQAIST